jgi:hypothetical protein
MLLPLGDYGGFSRTHALLPGSPALDAGLRNADFPFDQRGAARPEGSTDIGAFESRGFTLTAVSGGSQSAPPGSPFAEPLVVAVESIDGEPVAGGWVTFSAPSSGASAVLSSSTAMINASGQAGVRATAGAVPGTFAVDARAGAGSGTSFELTNEGTPPPVEVTAQIGAPTPASSDRPGPSSSTQRPSPYRAASTFPRAASPGPLGPIASRWGPLADRSALRDLLLARRRTS